jgi:replicative DNA helicase
VERREDNRPQLSDLRESGAIEQDADVVLLLYREEYYARNNPNIELSEKDENKSDIIIAKQRNGPTGVVSLNFFGDRVRFENRSGRDDPY